MINSEEYSRLITSLKIGSSVAEQDDLLEAAKVETPVLYELLQDKVDLILGTKGSGKTSLFRLVLAVKDWLLNQHRILIITGVEPQGNAVFNSFHKEFERFSESDFENFWKIYFVNLIYNNFLVNPSFKHVLFDCTKEISDFCDASASIGIPQIKVPTDFSHLVQKTIAALYRPIKKFKAGVGLNAQQPTLFKPELEVEFQEIATKEDNVPLYVSKLGELLELILQKTHHKIWIMLDRLDIVFEHGSTLEFIALRGLLKAYESFQVRAGTASKNFRIKIFLRDDIFDFLTSPEQFKKISSHRAAKLAALTHIASRATRTPLRWNKEQIQLLILKRLFISKDLQTYYAIISVKELEKESVRHNIWNQIFGEKIEQGAKKSDSLSWIITRLSDSHQVTPRSAIDFLEGTIGQQMKIFNLNKIDQDKLFNPNAVKHGVVVASNEKYIKETKNEYPKIIKYAEMLRGYSANITEVKLEKLYRKETEIVVPELEKIGLLSRSGRDYKVSFIFRAALNVHPQV